jgi:membrane protein implicated in regulation of membrane protease activity
MIDPAYFWFILGILVLVIEVFTFSVILLFVSFSLITVGGFLFFGFVDYDDKVMQSVVFFASIFFWFIALWVPIKKIKMLQLKKGYKNIIDQKAQVIGVLQKGKIGNVKWSGVSMKATISDDNLSSQIDKGEIVKIISIEGNTLTVTNNS